MCGIAGTLSLDPRAEIAPREVVERMCAVIRHRGPDDQGVHYEQRVGLGVRRLSIIDLVTGHMPIHNEDHSVWVVFNGEVYNFQALRSRLVSQGHRFYTSTDSEVLVHQYEEHGSAFVKQLRGMFAIALWDAKKQELLLA